MSEFKKFQKVIRSLGGIWEGQDIYFAQQRDKYFAAYMPDYPLESFKDEIIILGEVFFVEGSPSLSSDLFEAREE